MTEEKGLIIYNAEDLSNTISDFNHPITKYFHNLGLPTDNVLYPIKDRMIILESFGNAIKELNTDKKRSSTYLTKFAASISVGLFDGAITYLWNETIQSIRQKVIDFDLSFFYTIAKEVNSRYKNLNTEDELKLISEYDLLYICNKIGILDDHVFEVFKHINYMRNHASSAHPNENRVRPYDILSWLDNCIVYAINAEPNPTTMQLKQLLYNVRETEIPQNDLIAIGEKIQNYPTDTIDTVLQTFFGQYVDTNVKQSTKNNIKHLARFVWDASSESKKHEIGEKYGYYRNTGSVEKKDLTMEFLTIVNGMGYRDEDSIAADIRIILNNLKSVHFSINNFYNEAPIARELEDIIPESGKVPDSVRQEFVKVLVLCVIGNGLGYYEGVDMNAEPIYKNLIKILKQKDIYNLLLMMDDRELLTDMDKNKPVKRFKKILSYANDNIITNNALSETVKFVISYSAPIINMHKETKYKEMLKTILI